MKFIKTLLASSISLLLLGTAGCSDNTAQDTQQEDATSFTGLVIDGRVARGFVWVDTDDDGHIDTHEPYAYTDSDGYYGYNPLTNTNYCDDLNNQYCLNTGMVEGDFIIRIAGGVDLSTGEPFDGLMTLHSNTNDAKEVEQQVSEMSGSETSKPDFMPVISPFTSIVGNLSAADKATILNKLGLEDLNADNVEEMLKVDFTDFQVEGDVQESSSKTAKSANRKSAQDLTAEQLVSLDYFANATVYQKTTRTLSNLVFAFFEQRAISISELLSDNVFFGKKLDDAILEFIWEKDHNTTLDGSLLAQISDEDIVYIIKKAFFDIPKVMAIFDNDDYKSAISSTSDAVSSIANLTEEVLRDRGSVGHIKVGLLASQIGYSTLLTKSNDLISTNQFVRENAHDILDDVISTMVSDDFSDAIIDIIDTGRTLDIKQLSDDLADTEKSLADSIANATLAQAPENGEAGIWAQRVLSMSGKSEDGERGRILIFFGGDDTSDKKGDVSICYAYNANNNDEDVKATLIKGTWQELNSRGIVQLNQALISFTIKALKQAPIPAEEIGNVVGLGDETASSDDNFGHFRFVNDGRQELWFSDIAVEDTSDTRDFGLVDATTIPTTPAQCESFAVNGVENALVKNLGF
ncbi:hypothetical protein [uncultured Psychrosphaera sp.]|uniref:hypothetical protein n=1 Tax=uncultured Psychrosphaera sp. TaxID=1403522 RepID=UPI0030FBFF30